MIYLLKISWKMTYQGFFDILYRIDERTREADEAAEGAEQPGGGNSCVRREDLSPRRPDDFHRPR